MMQISSTFRGKATFSPRTGDYLATLMREGENFDYLKWHERVMRQKAYMRHTGAGFNFSDAFSRAGNLISTPGSEDGRLSLGPAPTIRAAPVAKSIFRRSRHDTGDGEIRIRRRLEKVRIAFDEFQASRVRDAVYAYLEAVFAIVEHYKVRRKTQRLLRHAFKSANLRVDLKSDVFTSVIRGTSAEDVDSKTISKWARALRYVACRKVPPTRVKTFMKEVGGVNACADRYAKYLGQKAR